MVTELAHALLQGLSSLFSPIDRKPPRVLATRVVGAADKAADYEDPASAFGCAKIKSLFGWTPTYSWRDVLGTD
jgi:hypothetical protein